MIQIIDSYLTLSLINDVIAFVIALKNEDNEETELSTDHNTIILSKTKQQIKTSNA